MGHEGATQVLFGDPKRNRNRFSKKKFYRAYELIYGKKYDPVRYRRPAIEKEDIKVHCGNCSKRSTCKELCPTALAYVEQDNKNYQRERTYGNTDILMKKSSKGLCQDQTDNDVEDISKKDDNDERRKPLTDIFEP